MLTMEIQMLAGPVIGAVIGYCTNYIAVKMLFRPLHPVKLLGRTLPFTPGIIPRGKKRLAKAVGEAVGKQLLTEDSLSETLLSPAIEAHLKEKVRLFLYENRKSEASLKEVLIEYIGEPVYETGFQNAKALVTDRLTEKILEMDLGEIIADEAARAVKERMGGGFLSLLMTDSVMESLKAAVSDGINRYLDEHAGELIAPRVEAECMAAMETKVGTVVSRIDDCGLPIDGIVWDLYTALVQKKLGAALKRLDISGMIKRRIDEMDVLEVERMMLSIMQKELNAVVGLGAVIGFVLGLVNLLIR